ncbi:coiled-coil domain-containing protein 112 [Astyanax mexicanus]|uniref:coiled-coil domain-containing protein 112 n=1 Tax=Astyanax mexicanus TaxID=7994 RepID=UPI0020CADF56|nr:coiled-coil domain-containing protein 112 [Astyanax mexicanus]XP_022526833.2 coiled-coil domain-containing protein 112 [Astyanax mexicanus]XP_049341837.1 coiled-coil domain-containing protein 112 [Astyanax mexicanus]XP_049341838.1 coiled-coil domain-containing protein 112 [Astyanax mexicanus]
MSICLFSTVRTQEYYIYNPDKMHSSEERIAAVKTAEFLRKAEQLRKLADKCEKERKWNNSSRKNGLKDCFCSLEELDSKLNSELKTEIIRVQQQLQKIRNSVYRFQGQLIDVKPSPDLIERLKDVMSEIESSINIMKEEQHQRFEELLKEERICWQEMYAFEKKIDAWSLSGKKDSEIPAVASKARQNRCIDKKGKEELPTEVTALETFLQQTGGKLGGWDQYDHQSFLQVWTKHHGKPSYRAEVKFYLPGKTEEHIRLHEEWYLELCHLQEKKKEAIQKWRAEKQRAREARLQDQEGEAEKKEREAAAAEAQSLKQEEQRKEAAARLEAWRNQRKQQEEQQEEQRLREEILRRKQLKEERRRQLEVKLTVEAHSRQKREEEELRLLEKQEQERAEMEERRRLAAEGIRRFQDRDLHKLETKLQEKQAKEEEESERLKKQAKLKEKVESNINRDPSRLWKPTKGWEERTKEIGPTGGGPVYQMFHRAVPAWRQDL